MHLPGVGAGCVNVSSWFSGCKSSPCRLGQGDQQRAELEATSVPPPLGRRLVLACRPVHEPVREERTGGTGGGDVRRTGPETVAIRRPAGTEAEPATGISVPWAGLGRGSGWPGPSRPEQERRGSRGTNARSGPRRTSRLSRPVGSRVSEEKQGE